MLQDEVELQKLEEQVLQAEVELQKHVGSALSVPSVVLHAVLLLGDVVLVLLVPACQQDLVDVQSFSGGVELVVAQGRPPVSLATGIPKGEKRDL